jgi:hypothetical protein
MKWITRSHVHVDRVACPWLIKRFVDNQAEFLFAPAGGIEAMAAEQQAILFDAPGAELGHRDEQCSFDAVIQKFQLTDKALLLMAKIVRAADTNKLQAHPLAAGLKAVAEGYSVRFPDDEENIRRQMDVYDALYAWCRLEVAKT